MKIGFFSFHTFSKQGGVKTHILGLRKAFQKDGFETRIIAPRRSIFERYSKDIILLGTSFEIHFGGGETDLDVVFTPFSIEGVLQREKFDILHFHNLILPAGLQILNSPLAQRPLKILTFHSNLERSKTLERFPIFISLLNKILNWKIDGLICVSQFILKFFEEYNGPKVVIPNGVDIDLFKPKEKKKEKIKKILFVGRIEERKGPIYLLKAFKILSSFRNDIELILVGEGEQKKFCQEYVKKEGLKNVSWPGSKQGKDLVKYYQECDVFVAPSIFGESFGIVLLEAMACQKPVVAFDIDGFREVLKGKGKEFLVEKGNVEKLAEKINLLLLNENLRKEMGEWGRKEALLYSWDKIKEQVLNFYHFCQEEREKKNYFSK